MSVSLISPTSEAKSVTISPASSFPDNPATVLVAPEQARLLAELEQKGKIHAALVFRGDSTQARKFLEEQRKVLEELYVAGFPPAYTPAGWHIHSPEPAHRLSVFDPGSAPEP